MAMRKLRAVSLTFLAATAPALAQGQGEVALGSAWLWQHGSQASFRSQYNLGEGLFLQSLHLDLRPWWADYQKLKLEAEGFGAQPYGRFRFLAAWDREWRWELAYQRREHFFSLPSWDFGQRKDRWRWQRWTSSLAYEGFRRLHLAVNLSHGHRDGLLSSPFYALGRAYVRRAHLAESESLASLTVTTRNLPLQVAFEQGVSRQLWRSRLRVGNQGQPADGEDPDLLVGFGSPRDDERMTPYTRLFMGFRTGRWNMELKGLYQKASLDAQRLDRELFAVGGGQQGSVAFVDALRGDADLQTGQLFANVGLALSPELSVRLTGASQKRDHRGSLIGERILELEGPGGRLSLPLALDERGFLYVKDSSTGVEFTWHKRGMQFSGFWRQQQEDVAWRRGRAGVRQERERDADLWGVTASWRGEGGLTASLGFERRMYSQYVFRLDPETVERASGKIRIPLQPSWHLELSASRETGDSNGPPAQVSHRAEEFTLATYYTAEGGAQAWLSWSRLNLTSDVGIFFYAPQGASGTSAYRLWLDMATANIIWPLSPRWKAETACSWLSDSGRASPFDGLRLTAAVAFQMSEQLSCKLEGSHFDFDEAHRDESDYRANRLGLVLTWRF